MTDSRSTNSAPDSRKKRFDRLTADALGAVFDHGMLREGDEVLVGVSGGPDSVALLHFLIDIQERFHLKLGVAHVNHCLRKAESDRDAGFVSELAAREGLPLHMHTVDVAQAAARDHLSLEEAARETRYAFFRKILDSQGYGKVALGHTLDDNAELVLMNLLRGSGLRGLGGIPPERDGWIVRPLIRVSRETILNYLNTKGQAHIVDSSNADTDFLRNRVRNHLIPLLAAEYNPGIIQVLDRVSRIIREENDWMEAEMDLKFSAALVKRGDAEVQLDRDVVLDYGEVVARRVIRKAIQAVKGDLRRISYRHVADALTLAGSSEPGKSIDLPDGIRISRLRDSLSFRQESIPLRVLGRKKKADRFRVKD
ncbi:MAG: tRNA lysidine(34) synthetase TilS [Pseudomonadota bacterium]